jgi:serine-protein kinase ATM
MELMHASHEAILTILQVLLYDPLYAWTISPVRAYQLQHRHAAEQELADPNMNVSATDLLDGSCRRQSSKYHVMLLYKCTT